MLLLISLPENSRKAIPRYRKNVLFGYGIGYDGVLRDRAQKNRRKLLSLRRLGVGGTGFEPVTSTV